MYTLFRISIQLHPCSFMSPLAFIDLKCGPTKEKKIRNSFYLFIFIILFLLGFCLLSLLGLDFLSLLEVCLLSLQVFLFYK